MSIPTEKGITLELDDTEFLTGHTVTVKGIAQSDSSRLQIEVTNVDGTIVDTLETPLTDDGTFSVPWVIPSGFDTGSYTITISDTENSDSIQIFIQ